MAFDTEKAEHYKNAAGQMGLLADVFDPAVKKVHQQERDKTAEHLLREMLESMTGVKNNPGRIKLALALAGDNSFVKEEKARREKQASETLVFILLMHRLDQLNEQMKQIRTGIADLEDKIIARHGAEFDEHYADKYLGDRFERQRPGETTEDYRIRVAKAIKAKIDSGEVEIDEESDPYLRDWLERYLELSEVRDEVRDVKRDLKSKIEKAQQEGRLSAEDPDVIEAIEELGIEEARELRQSTQDKVIRATADTVWTENVIDQKTTEAHSDGFGAVLAAEGVNVGKASSSRPNNATITGKSASAEFSTASNPDTQTEKTEVAFIPPKGVFPGTGQG